MEEKFEILESRNIKTGLFYYEFSGLSSIDKPTWPQIATGSLFHEVDTATYYAYDAYTQTWYKQIELGGDD